MVVPYKGLGALGYTRKFVNNVGDVEIHYYHSWPYPISGSYSELIGCIMALLKDSAGNYVVTSGKIKPKVIVNPIQYITSVNFNWFANVTHKYSRVMIDNSLNFVDRTFLSGYYSYDDSIKTSEVIVPGYFSGNNYYKVDIELDSALLKHGWVYNYKLYATDLGIYPDTATAPDSGYYTCRWFFPSEINEPGNNVIRDYELYQNYPNPFNPSTIIMYTLPYASKVNLKIYDLLGREVALLVEREESAGKHLVTFEAKDLPSGFYFYRLIAGNISLTKKMCIVR